MSKSMNIYEQSARRCKAERLAFHLNASGILAADVPNIPARFWPQLAKAAGVNFPSAETLALVEELLREMEAAKARVDHLLATSDPWQAVAR